MCVLSISFCLAYRSMGEYVCNVCRRRVCAGHGESRGWFLKYLIGDIKVLMAS